MVPAIDLCTPRVYRGLCVSVAQGMQCLEALDDHLYIVTEHIPKFCFWHIQDSPNSGIFIWQQCLCGSGASYKKKIEIPIPNQIPTKTVGKYRNRTSLRI